MATQLGKPAINDPKGTTLRDLQQVVGNVRERFRGLDVVMTELQVQQRAGAQTSANSLTALKKQLTALSQALTQLQTQVDGLDLGGGEADPRVEQITGELVEIRAALDEPRPDPRTEQIAGELVALQAAIDGMSAPDAGDAARLPQVEAELSTLQQQFDALDAIGQTANHSALLDDLQSQIGDIRRGILI